MHNVIFAGTYSSLNTGDAALHLATQKILQSVRADVKIRVHSRTPAADQVVYKEMSVFACSRGQWRDISLLGTALVARLLKSFSITLPSSFKPQELLEYEKADLVVDLSGDAFSEDWGFIGILTHLMPLWLARLTGTPIVLYGQSFGPFRRTRPFVSRTFRTPELIFPRDEISAGVLAGMGVQPDRIRLTFDPAFSLMEAAEPEVHAALSDESLVSVNHPIVTVVISAHYCKLFDDLPKNRKSGMTFCRLLADVLDSFTEKFGFSAVFLPFSIVPHETGLRLHDDRSVGRQVVAHAKCAHKIKLVERRYSPGILKGIIGRSDLLVGARMHSNVLASSMGVPNVGLAYSSKFAGLFHRLGLDECVLEMEKVDEESLLAILTDTWNNRFQIREKLLVKTAEAQVHHRHDGGKILQEKGYVS